MNAIMDISPFDSTIKAGSIGAARSARLPGLLDMTSWRGAIVEGHFAAMLQAPSIVWTGEPPADCGFPAGTQVRIVAFRLGQKVSGVNACLDAAFFRAEAYVEYEVVAAAEIILHTSSEPIRARDVFDEINAGFLKQQLVKAGYEPELGRSVGIIRVPSISEVAPSVGEDQAARLAIATAAIGLSTVGEDVPLFWLPLAVHEFGDELSAKMQNALRARWMGAQSKGFVKAAKAQNWRRSGLDHSLVIPRNEPLTRRAREIAEAGRRERLDSVAECIVGEVVASGISIAEAKLNVEEYAFSGCDAHELCEELKKRGFRSVDSELKDCDFGVTLLGSGVGAASEVVCVGTNWLEARPELKGRGRGSLPTLVFGGLQAATGMMPLLYKGNDASSRMLSTQVNAGVATVPAYWRVDRLGDIRPQEEFFVFLESSADGAVPFGSDFVMKARTDGPSVTLFGSEIDRERMTVRVGKRDLGLPSGFALPEEADGVATTADKTLALFKYLMEEYSSAFTDIGGVWGGNIRAAARMRLNGGVNGVVLETGKSGVLRVGLIVGSKDDRALREKMDDVLEVLVGVRTLHAGRPEISAWEMPKDKAGANRTKLKMSHLRLGDYFEERRAASEARSNVCLTRALAPADLDGQFFAIYEVFWDLVAEDYDTGLLKIDAFWAALQALKRPGARCGSVMFDKARPDDLASARIEEQLRTASSTSVEAALGRANAKLLAAQEKLEQMERELVAMRSREAARVAGELAARTAPDRVEPNRDRDDMGDELEHAFHIASQLRGEVRSLKGQLHHSRGQLAAALGQSAPERAPEEEELPESFSDLETWAMKHEARMVVTSKAVSAAVGSLYGRPQKAFAALEILATDYWTSRFGPLGERKSAHERVQKRLADERLEISRTGTAVESRLYEDQYRVRWRGSSYKLDMHVKSGVSFGPPRLS